MPKEGFEYIHCPFFPSLEYRPVFLQEVFELVYHGNGGFSWQDVWSMPIPHRKFSLKKINEFLGKVQEQRNQQSQTITEKTDMQKFKMSDDTKNAMVKPPDFVSKSKAKK
jgi:hypothetical protein